MQDVRILDLSLNLPGPYATFILACQGADVVKLEPPKGDPARHLGDFFQRVNRGKRSVMLDLRDPRNHEAMWRLIAWADVLVEGFRPGVMERLGFGPLEVHNRHPELIYCRISAFGQDGPRRLEPGHDLNLQALTGLPHLERSRTTPRANRLPIADLSTSLIAVAAIQGALGQPRERIVLDLAMSDTLLSWVWLWEAVDPGALAASAVKRPRLRRLLARPLAALGREKLYAMPQYGLYPTADGWIAIGIVDEQPFWTAFAEALDLHRVKDWRMATRTLAGPYLRFRIARKIRRATTAHWLAVLGDRGLPVSAVNDLPAALAEPQFARVVVGGSVIPGIPGARLPEREAPELGAHTADLLY